MGCRWVEDGLQMIPGYDGRTMIAMIGRTIGLKMGCRWVEDGLQMIPDKKELFMHRYTHTHAHTHIHTHTQKHHT